MNLTRRELLKAIPAAAICPALAQQTPPDARWRLWYKQPAARWLDALPVGNGRLGAMVFGGVKRERIALNEATLWSGAPNASNINPTALQYLDQIRRLLFDGKYAEANSLCAKHLGGREDSYGTHLPLGNLWIEQSVQLSEGAYERSLNLETAVASTRYGPRDVQIESEVFASNPAGVIVVRISGIRKGGLSLGLSLESGDLPSESFASEHTLTLLGSSWEKKHSDGHIGVDFKVVVQAAVEGGRVAAVDSKIQIEDADSVTLIIAANTSYNGTDYHRACAEQIEQAGKQRYESLRSEHLADHQRLFNRVHIDLGGGASEEPTDRRIALTKTGSPDPALAALFFQYGRYLMIAGSRENSPLPLNLQGIWNDNLAANMVWTCDFHLDINTQQNYWPSEVANVAECNQPLFTLIESLSHYGRSTAKDMYGARGWVCHVYTNAWGFTAPGVGLPWGPFVTGGAWIAYHLWEHFLFSRDRRFLRERAYPVLKGSAEFFLDCMTPEPEHGWLVTGPSLSPENQFLAPDGARCSVSMGPTCDRELVFALLSSCLEAAEFLGVDTAFREQLTAALAKLPPLQVGKHGQLQEWLHDFDEAEPNHRHTSHLVGLYPLDQITVEKTPQLANAARVTLERRTSQKNWEDVEWSRANLINFYARLQDGDTAHKHLIGLLSEDSDNNLLTFSRAGVAGARENIFAIDGNTAGAAGIAEMLLQSHSDIHVLPALPSQWLSGEVKGLRARGGYEVGFQWSDGRLTSLTVSSALGGKRRVRYGKHVANIELKPAGVVHLSGELKLAAT